MNDIVENHGGALAPSSSPFGKMALSTSINHGAVAIESERAIAEARGQMQLAKMFPRSVTAAITEFMDACRSLEFAKAAFYSVPNRGSGPSIRFAEEAARCYGNFEYGHRELSRSDGKSEIEVYAWDKEKNNRSTRQITVMHVMDTRNGARALTDQADIDNKIANVASKQIRGRILALMPKHMIAAGIAECKKTLAGDNEKPLRDRVLAVVNAFAKYGITNAVLTRHLGHSVDDTTADELADLIGIGNALKEGAKASEYFQLSDDTEKTGASITEQAKLGAAQGKTSDSKAPQEATAAPAATEKPAAKKGKAAESESKPTKEARQESADNHDAAANEAGARPSGNSGQQQDEGDDVF